MFYICQLCAKLHENMHFTGIAASCFGTTKRLDLFVMELVVFTHVTSESFNTIKKGKVLGRKKILAFELAVIDLLLVVRGR